MIFWNKQGGFIRRLILIDGSSVVYRAYNSTKPKIQSQATLEKHYHNYLHMVNSLINSYIGKNKYIIVAFEGKNLKKREIYPEYKINSKRNPKGGKMQKFFQIYLDLIKYKGIKSIEIEGYEADDIIGSFSKKGEEKGIIVDIFSSDKDFFQLVKNNITIRLIENKGKVMKVTKKNFESTTQFSSPKVFFDYKVMSFDERKNKPGIQRIKNADIKRILEKFGSLVNVIKKVNTIKDIELKKEIKNFIPIKNLSRKLTKIIKIIPDLEDIDVFSISKRSDENKEDIDKLFSKVKEACKSPDSADE